MMKTYNILGSTVKISTEFENYMELERQMIPLLGMQKKNIIVGMRQEVIAKVYTGIRQILSVIY